MSDYNNTTNCGGEDSALLTNEEIQDLLAATTPEEYSGAFSLENDSIPRIREYVRTKRKESFDVVLAHDAEKVFKALANFLCEHHQPALVYASDKNRVSIRLLDAESNGVKIVETHLPFTLNFFDFVLARVPEFEKLPNPKGYLDSTHRYVDFSNE